MQNRARPFSIMPLVEAELDLLVKNDIFEKINSSEYATPIVPVLKKNNQIRICGDFSVTINKILEIYEHFLPTIDELLVKLSGGIYFSKIDLRQAYLQMRVDDESLKLLTLSTHRGLYRCKRLVENLLSNIKGMSVLLDDIVFASATVENHLLTLEEILKRLHASNIRINLDKYEFFKSKVHYCGHVIDKLGVHKDQQKVEAMESMTAPRDVNELRSFIGIVNYHDRFIKNLSTVIKPLNDLLHKDTKFIWSKQCDLAAKG